MLLPRCVDGWNRRCSFKLVIEERQGTDKCKLFSSVHDSVFISNVRTAECRIAELLSRTCTKVHFQLPRSAHCQVLCRKEVKKTSRLVDGWGRITVCQWGKEVYFLIFLVVSWKQESRLCFVKSSRSFKSKTDAAARVAFSHLVSTI